MGRTHAEELEVGAEVLDGGDVLPGEAVEVDHDGYAGHLRLGLPAEDETCEVAQHQELLRSARRFVPQFHVEHTAPMLIG